MKFNELHDPDLSLGAVLWNTPIFYYKKDPGSFPAYREIKEGDRIIVPSYYRQKILIRKVNKYFKDKGQDIKVCRPSDEKSKGTCYAMDWSDYSLRSQNLSYNKEDNYYERLSYYYRQNNKSKYQTISSLYMQHISQQEKYKYVPGKGGSYQVDFTSLEPFFYEKAKLGLVDVIDFSILEKISSEKYIETKETPDLSKIKSEDILKYFHKPYHHLLNEKDEHGKKKYKGYTDVAEGLSKYAETLAKVDVTKFMPELVLSFFYPSHGRTTSLIRDKILYRYDAVKHFRGSNTNDKLLRLQGYINCCYEVGIEPNKDFVYEKLGLRKED